MTPQQRLQEAKDQAAKESGFTSFDRMLGTNFINTGKSYSVINRACELMYEAGKKEVQQYCSDLEKSLEIAVKTVEIQNESLELVIEKAETFRKVLEDIADCTTWSQDDVIFMNKLAKEALKS